MLVGQTVSSHVGEAAVFCVRVCVSFSVHANMELEDQCMLSVACTGTK